VSAVYTAIHVENTTKSPAFDIFNGDVRASLAAEAMKDASQDYEDLLNVTTCDAPGGIFYNCSIGVFVYSGEFDSVNGALGQREWMDGLFHDGSDEFKAASRQIYWQKNASADDAWYVAGYYRQSKKLA